MDLDVARTRALFPSLSSGAAHFDGPGGSQTPRAVADAIARAKTLSDAAGVRLGKVVEITELTQPQPPMPMMARYEAKAAADQVPVEAGEAAYKVQVNVTFALE